MWGTSSSTSDTRSMWGTSIMITGEN